MGIIKIGEVPFVVAEDRVLTLDGDALARVWPDLPDELQDDMGQPIHIRAEGYVFRNAGALRDRMHKAYMDELWKVFQDILVSDPFDPDGEWPAIGTSRQYGTDRLTGEPLLCFSGYRATRALRSDEGKRWYFSVSWYRTRQGALQSSTGAMVIYVGDLTSTA